MSVEGALFWGAFRDCANQMRYAGACVVGVDYLAVEHRAAARGCPPEVCAFFFSAAESAALRAIHDRLRDSDG